MAVEDNPRTTAPAATAGLVAIAAAVGVGPGGLQVGRALSGPLDVATAQVRAGQSDVIGDYAASFAVGVAAAGTASAGRLR